MNLRELNHILIPQSADTLDRWRDKRWVRGLLVLATPLRALTREGQAVAVITLVAAAAGIDVRFSHLYLVFCGLFGLLAAAFLCRPLGRVRGLEISVEHPPRVAAGEPVTFTVVLHNRGDRPLYALRVWGPFLPWDATWIERRPSVDVLAPGATVRVLTRARFLLRGQRIVGRFTVASVRPLGLMRGPTRESARVAFIVVPRVVPVDDLPLPLGGGAPPDERGRTRTAGESFELLGVRPYRPGDRIRDLHARSWARLGVPMVREYRHAQRLRVAVMLHAAYRGGPREPFEAAVCTAASLAAWAVRQDAIVDLLIVGSEVTEVELGADVASLERALDALAPVGPVREAAGAEAALGGRLGRLGAALLVLPRWSDARGAEIDRLRRLGVPVEVFCVTGSVPPPPGVRAVTAGDLAQPVLGLA